MLQKLTLFNYTNSIYYTLFYSLYYSLAKVLLYLLLYHKMLTCCYIYLLCVSKNLA